MVIIVTTKTLTWVPATCKTWLLVCFCQLAHQNFFRWQSGHSSSLTQTSMALYVLQRQPKPSKKAADSACSYFCRKILGLKIFLSSTWMKYSCIHVSLYLPFSERQASEDSISDLTICLSQSIQISCPLLIKHKILLPAPHLFVPTDNLTLKYS